MLKRWKYLLLKIKLLNQLGNYKLFEAEGHKLIVITFALQQIKRRLFNHMSQLYS